MLRSILLFILFLFFLSGNINAHGDLHKRIKEVSEQIKNYPDSAYLYLKRGKLYLQHESYKKSLADLNKSQRLGYNSIEQELLFAKTHLKLEDYLKSINYSSGIIEKDPMNVRAIRLRALTYFEIGNFYQAANDYDDVLRFASEKIPENYIEAANAWELQKTEESNQRAIDILKTGIDKIGPIISLYDRILELYLDHQDHDAAILIQLEIIDLMDRTVD